MQIILLYFLTSIVITFIILYLYNQDPQIILKYPNYEKPLSDLYIDNKNVCYKYKTKEVDCNKTK